MATSSPISLTPFKIPSIHSSSSPVSLTPFKIPSIHSSSSKEARLYQLQRRRRLLVCNGKLNGFDWGRSPFDHADLGGGRGEKHGRLDEFALQRRRLLVCDGNRMAPSGFGWGRSPFYEDVPDLGWGRVEIGCRKTDYDTEEETLRKLEEKQEQKRKTIERDEERRSKPLKKKYYNPNQIPNPVPNPMPDPVPNPMPDPVPNPTPDLSPENGYSQIAVKWIQFDSSRLLDMVEQADGANLVFEYLTNVIYSQFEVSRHIKAGTRQHRAPELMLAAPYSNAVDIRAVRCIFAEMVKRKPIFCVLITDIDVMNEMISLFGVPEESEWQRAETYIFDFFGDDTFPAEATKELASSVVPGLEPEGLDLLLKMLCIDLHERISVKTVVT